MIKIIKNLLNQNILIDNAPCIEWCSTCGEEVEIQATFDKVQKCPECEEHILPCNLCDTDKTDCFKCQNIYRKMIAGEYKRQQVPAENIIILESYYYKFSIEEKELKAVIKYLYDIDDIEIFLDNYIYDDVEHIIHYLENL